MIESWLLVISIGIAESRNSTVISGFKSKLECEEKGKIIAIEIIKQQHRITKTMEGQKAIPHIEYSCLK